MKYRVQIARNETTVYTYEVRAKTEDEAEDKAYHMYGIGEEPINEDVVYGDEFVHEVTQIEGKN
jgi:hypothetical protein